MKTLSEHNRERFELLHKTCGAFPRPSGIACDKEKCGHEMDIVGITAFSATNLISFKVRCPWCGYEGVMEA